MPIHDWTRVSAGTYHDFHQDWTIEIRRTLNRGILPPGYVAMADQRVSGPEPDVLALKLRGPETVGGLAVAERPPRLAQATRGSAEAARYAVKANRISIRQGLGRVVAIIELVSPGNKDRKGAVGEFVEKAVEFIRNGVHFLMIDPFPSGRHDPDGLASLIWEQVAGGPFPERPAGKPLTLAAFDAGEPMAAYVEGLSVGDEWPMAPLFLAPEWYVEVPLEETYGVSWGVTPGPIREIVEGTVA
jgi:hypothetical protein